MKRLLLNWSLFWLIAFGPFVFAGNHFKYVDPFIGTGKGKGGLGNVTIGPSCPFGMIKPGPDNNKASNSGYLADTLQPIYGFSQTHVSGTGGGPKYGNIAVMPFSGDAESITQTSLRTNEIAKAGYYSVLLKKWNIRTEITVSPKVAFYRFVYGNKTKCLKLDAGDFLGEKSIPDSREAQQFVGSEVRVESDCAVSGYSRIRGGWNNGDAYTVYFYAMADRPFTRFTSWKGNKLSNGTKGQVDTGEKTGALLYFDDASGDTVRLKIAISFISPQKAKQNLEQEVPHWSFEQLRAETENRWENLLKRIEISDDATPDQKKMFYTALYHTMLMPVDRTGENPKWTSDQPYYDDFYAIWDTYRSSHPLITLIAESRQVDIVKALLDIYKRDGYLPDARSGNCNGRTQGGSNAEVLIADAYVKGLKGIDYGLGLQAMLKDATVPPGGSEEKEGRGGLTDYNTLGYVSDRFVRAGNRTLEYAYDDYCIARVAKGLNRMNEYRRFLKQSNNWQNLWRDIEDHGARGFIMPKDATGRWIDSIPCDIANGQREFVLYTPTAQDWPNCLCWWCGFFYEAGSWEYSLSVPHNVPRLIEKCGGKDMFRKRLDTLFDSGFYNVGNEPSFLTSCLYHWIGRPDLSSERTRKIITDNYDATSCGIPGNDDSGAMSSWLDFHLMGLYPNAGQSYYLITSPFFRQTKICMENGKIFVITAKNLSDKNRFVKSAALNGVKYDKAWIEHADVAAGGELLLEMGDKPSQWGTTQLPPSGEF
jgi:predicted alpha-1,2-mannosidase